MNGFVTKDSGRRQEFASGMKRDTQDGKIRYHLIYHGPMLERWAALLTRGAEKYDEGNWLKAEGKAEYERFRASAARHFHQWMRGDTDEDHAAAVIFNLNGAEYVRGKMFAKASRVSNATQVLDLEYEAAVQLQREAEEEARKVATNLDACGTIDGVTPIPVCYVKGCQAHVPGSPFQCFAHHPEVTS